MKKKYLFFCVVFIFLLTGFAPLMGQKGIVTSSGKKETPVGKIKWMANPFDHQVFIENGGQFNGPSNNDKVLYGAQVGDVYVFITPHGLIYKYTELPRVSNDGKKRSAAVDPDDIDWKKKPIDHYMTAMWEGSGGGTGVVAGEEQTGYYTYPGADNKSTIKVNVFKTVTCQNVYPGIDIKYSFISGKDGFKYAMIVHPGGDISKIKLKYNGARKMFIDNDGNIQINSEWGTFTDHAPKSYYDGENSAITSSYQLQNNTESFQLTNPDAGKTLVIDPWSTNWTSSYGGGNNGAFDVDYDNAGNVYVFGSNGPYQLAKYNSAGVQVWTYNATNLGSYYGDFCVVKPSGSCLCFGGFNSPSATSDKVSSSGSLVNTLTTGNLCEQWRAAYDVCSNTVVIAGGGTSLTLQAATFDTANVTCKTANILNLPPGSPLHDMSLIGIDPIVDTVYMATARSVA